MKLRLIFLFSIIFDIIIFDQVSKFLATRYLAEPQDIINGFLSLEYHQNYGIAFSIMLPQIAVILATALLLTVGVYVAYRHLDFANWAAVIFSGLAIGGALGNLIDRLRFSYVIDFISIWIWPVFNIADMAIVIGLLGILQFYDKIKKAV